MRCRGRTAVVLVAGVLLSSCGEGADTPVDEVAASRPADRAAASVTAEKGPVRVTLSLVPGDPSLSDEPTLTLSIAAAPGVAVELPQLASDPSNTGAFRLLDLRDPPPRVDPASGAKTVERICRIEPLESGEQTIAPVTVAFTADGDPAPHEVTTEPLRVTVGVPHAGEAASLDRVGPPIEPTPIAVPRPTRIGLIIASLVGFVLVLAAFFALLSRRRRRPVAPPTAEDLARAEFARLLEDDPLARGELTTFYVELTAIVRRYVERTTGIRAPEQTTEEFLRVCQARGAFDRETRTRLVAFLEAADLVKFAAGRPSPDDIADSLARARAFCGLAPECAATAGVAR